MNKNNNEKITSIALDYHSSNHIHVMLEVENSQEKKEIIQTKLAIEIERDKENIFFTDKRIATKDSLTQIKDTNYYDRITHKFITDEKTRNMVANVFSDKSIKNIIMIDDGNKKRIFTNVPEELPFKIANRGNFTKNNIDNLESKFFTSELKEDNIDFLNSIKFSYQSYGLAKDVIDKLCKKNALDVLRHYATNFDFKINIQDTKDISSAMTKHYINKYLNLGLEYTVDEEKLQIGNIIEIDSGTNNYFKENEDFIAKLLDNKNLRNMTNFKRLLKSDEATSISRTNIPFENEKERILSLRYDTLLINQSQNTDLNKLSNFYKDKEYGYLCVQSDKNSLIGRHLYELDVNRNNLELSLQAALSSEANELNKVIDLRKVTDEVRESLLEKLFTTNAQNVSIIMNDKNDAMYVAQNLKQGNIYKVDSRVLEDTPESDVTYIADIANITYSYNPKYDKEKLNEKSLNKIIDISEFSLDKSRYRNTTNAIDKNLEIAIKTKEFLDTPQKINSLYKYEKNTLNKFNITPIANRFRDVKDAVKLFNFTKANLPGYIQKNMSTLFTTSVISADRKMFPDNYYYNTPRGHISAKDIAESPIHSYYFANTPIAPLISNIINKTENGKTNFAVKKPFSLSDKELNKLNAGPKEQLVSKSIGALKFAHYPTFFELKEEDKKVLQNVVKQSLMLREKNEAVINGKLNELEKVLETSSFLQVKSELSVADNSKFAPTEVLVLVDEDLSDIAKINIPTNDFYAILEKDKIFELSDYVEVPKVNTTYLEKVTGGLKEMIKSFRKEQLAASKIDEDKYNSFINEKGIKINNMDLSPLELLMSNAPENIKEKTFKQLGDKLGILDYYKNFLDFDEVKNISTWLEKKVDEKSFENIKTFLDENFIGKEIEVLDKDNVAFFSYLKQNIEDKKIYDELESKIWKAYHNIKTETHVVSKTFKMYAVETLLDDITNSLDNIDKNLTREEQKEQKLAQYQKMKYALDIIGKDIMGLREDQYEKALNFSILNNNNQKNIMNLYDEMRSGKTRTALATNLFSSFLNPSKLNHRVQFFIQNNNLDDIAAQISDFFPITVRNTIINTDKKVASFKIDSSLNMPINIAKQITPQLLVELKDVIKFEGQKTDLKSDRNMLLPTYREDMNQIQQQLTNYSLNDLLDMYKDSPYIEVLKLAKKKKVDNEIENSIKQSFMYVQFIHERGFIKPGSQDFIFDKMNSFVEKYIENKDKLKDRNLNKFGIDLIPKNLLYSVNVKAENKQAVEKIGNSFFKTSFDIKIDTPKEILVQNLNSEQTKLALKEQLALTFGMPKVLKNLTQQGIINSVATSDNPTDILIAKETIAFDFINSLSNVSKDVGIVLEGYIKENLDSSLKDSSLYRISALDEQILDTIELNMSELFDEDKLKSEFEKYPEINIEEVNLFINELKDTNKIQNFVEKSNKDYFNSSLYYLYDTSLSANISKRIEDISPLLKSKKELLYSFELDMELQSDNIIYPIKKKTLDNNVLNFIDSVNIHSENINMFDLANKTKNSLEGLQVKLGYSNSKPIITVKEEQNKSLLLTPIPEKSISLNMPYNIDIRDNISRVAIDEVHKGIKGEANKAANYIEKLAIGNGGNATNSTATPTGEIGRISTIGADNDLTSKVVSNIEKYCTTYKFKEPVDLCLYSAIKAFPKGDTYTALTKALIVPEDRTEITKEKFKLDKSHLEKIQKEILDVIKSNPAIVGQNDIDFNSEIDIASIENRINHYKSILRIDDVIKKTEEGKKFRKKSDYNLESVLLVVIKKIADKTPSINNLIPFAKVLNLKEASFSIQRYEKNGKAAEYDIKDIDVIKEHDNSLSLGKPSNFNIENINDRILATSSLLDRYKMVTKIGTIKERVSNIFEAWAVELFNEVNRDKAIKMLDIENNYTLGLNELISKTGKTTKDSIADIFTTLYFGSEDEKFDLSTNKDLEQKVNLVLDMIDRFNDFTYNYYDFQTKASSLYKEEKENARNEERLENKVFIEKNGFKYNAASFSELSNDLETINLFEKCHSQVNPKVVTLSNTGDVFLEGNQMQFKVDLKINKWEHFFKDGLDLRYSLTNRNEGEILEYAGSNSKDLYLSHINNKENIRVMSARNSTLAMSFLDTVEALSNREDKTNKAVILLNNTSTKAYNFIDIINNIDKDFLNNANIEIKLTESHNFASILNETTKNKNNQVAVVANYLSLAEGIDMSTIDTGFYVNSIENGNAAIQSLARQLGHGKEKTSFYLTNNGLIERYSLNNQIDIEDILSKNSGFNSTLKPILKGEAGLNGVNDYSEENKLLSKHTYRIVPPTLKAATTVDNLKAYINVMSGLFPEAEHNAELPIVSYSNIYLEKQEAPAEMLDVAKEENNTLDIDIEQIGLQK